MKTNCWNCKNKIPKGIMLCPNCQVVVDENMIEDLDELDSPDESDHNDGLCWNCKEEIPEGVMICPNCHVVADKIMKNHLDDLESNSPLPQIEPGTIVAERYLIKREVGHGTMGVVFEAHDNYLDRTVALKVIPHELVSVPKAIADLKRETAGALDISHDNIVKLYNIDTWLGLTFVTMEFVDGGTLSHLMADKGDTFRPDKLVPLLKKIAEALDYAHTRKPSLIHRGLNPLTILITRDGQPKIADFGLSGVLRDLSSRLPSWKAAATTVYTAPEQINGEEIGPWTDIYALAGLTFELFSGQPPFSNGDHREQIINDVPAPTMGLSECRKQALMEGLAKDRGTRPKTAKQFVAMLTGEKPFTQSDEKDATEHPAQTDFEIQLENEPPYENAKKLLRKATIDLKKHLKNPVVLAGSAVLILLAILSSLPLMLKSDETAVLPSIQSKKNNSQYKYGQLHVDSQPSGADVFINGEEKGVTPLDLDQIKIGEAEVVLKKKRYYDSCQTVQITSLKKEITAKLNLETISDSLNAEDLPSALFKLTRPSENLEDWEKNYIRGRATLKTNGTRLHFKALGYNYSKVHGILKKEFSGAIGMIVTVNIATQNIMGGPGVGIHEDFGALANGHRVRIDLQTEAGESGGRKGLKFKISEQNFQGETIHVLVENNLGQADDMWSLCQDFTIGFARLDNSIWCYTDDMAQKVYNLGHDITLSSKGFCISTWADGWGYDFIEGTVKNVRIIYLGEEKLKTK